MILETIQYCKCNDLIQLVSSNWRIFSTCMHIKSWQRGSIWWCNHHSLYVILATWVANWKTCPKSIPVTPPVSKLIIKLQRCQSAILKIYWDILTVANVLIKWKWSITNASGLAVKWMKVHLTKHNNYNNNYWKFIWLVCKQINGLIRLFRIL